MEGDLDNVSILISFVVTTMPPLGGIRGGTIILQEAGHHIEY